MQNTRSAHNDEVFLRIKNESRVCYVQMDLDTVCCLPSPSPSLSLSLLLSSSPPAFLILFFVYGKNGRQSSEGGEGGRFESIESGESTVNSGHNTEYMFVNAFEFKR